MTNKVSFVNTMTRSVTPLEHKATPMPSVFFTTDAWVTIDYIVQKMDKEVGWFGLVDELEGGDYLVTEILIPKQEVTGVTVDISPDAVTQMVMQLMDDGKDPSKLRYHGHSHVNMGVTPSQVDQQHLAEYLEDSDWFIRSIHNKKGDKKVDVFDKRTGFVYQCVTADLYDLTREHTFFTAIDEQLRGSVSMRTFQQSNTYYQRGVHNYYDQFRSKQEGTASGASNSTAVGSKAGKGGANVTQGNFSSTAPRTIEELAAGMNMTPEEYELLSDPFYVGGIL